MTNDSAMMREDIVFGPIHSRRLGSSLGINLLPRHGKLCNFDCIGEPTLNPDFPLIVDITLALRDEYFPKAAVSVLSNATRVGRREVFEALRKVDNPILKLDAPTDALAAKINKPYPGYHVRQTVEELKKFEGNFVLQTMFLAGGGFDSSSPEVLDGWMDIVRELRPREVMVYTIDRETPAEGLLKATHGQLDGIKARVEALGIECQASY